MRKGKQEPPPQAPFGHLDTFSHLASLCHARIIHSPSGFVLDVKHGVL